MQVEKLESESCSVGEQSLSFSYGERRISAENSPGKGGGREYSPGRKAWRDWNGQDGSWGDSGRRVTPWPGTGKERQRQWQGQPHGFFLCLLPGAHRFSRLSEIRRGDEAYPWGKP